MAHSNTVIVPVPVTPLAVALIRRSEVPLATPVIFTNATPLKLVVLTPPFHSGVSPEASFLNLSALGAPWFAGRNDTGKPGPPDYRSIRARSLL